MGTNMFLLELVNVGWGLEMGRETKLSFQISFSFALSNLLWEIFLEGITFLNMETNSWYLSGFKNFHPRS